MKKWVSLLVCASSACFTPEEAGTAGADSEASSGTTASTSVGTTGTTSTTSASTSAGPTSGGSTTTAGSDTETGGPAVCGDGAVDGDEVCDDGTNDGSYGGCVEDCSALGPHCGDAELNGPEDCDDGINDGSYDGCNADCTVGPYCGDGIENGDEQCDEGEDNADGAGCNLDCVISGSLIGDEDIVLTGTFCEPPIMSHPAINPDGAALVTIGACPGETRVVAELSPEVDIAQDFSPLAFPSLPIFGSMWLNDAWATTGSSCEMSMSTVAGGLTEVCGNGRVYGVDAYHAISDDEYFALNSGTLAKYGAGSPATDDTEQWTVTPPDGGDFDYTFTSAALGANGQVVAAGFRRQISTNTYFGYLTLRNGSDGSQAGSRTISTVTSVDEIVAAPNGTTLAIINSPEYEVHRLNTNLNQAWMRTVSANSNIHGAVDSNGDVVLFYRDPNVGHYRLTKIRADGGADLWTIEYENLTTTTLNGLAIDPVSNAVWLSYLHNPGSFTVTVERRAP